MRTILRTLAIAAVMACDSSTVVEPVSVPLAELEAAPMTVLLNGQEVILTPYLWRDFMPPVPVNGRPMIAAFQVGSADSTALADAVTIDAAWVVNGDEVWAGTVGEGRYAQPTRVYYQVVMRGGPKWGPGITVDAVVRVRDSKGEAHLLRATGVPIHRTE